MLIAIIITAIKDIQNGIAAKLKNNKRLYPAPFSINLKKKNNVDIKNAHK